MNRELIEAEKVAPEYTAPTLKVYGGVVELTAGGTGISNEGSATTDVTKHP